MERFIIEHPTRGTFRELYRGESPTEVKARFSLTGARNDKVKTLMFSRLSNASKALEQIPTPVRYECDILVYNQHDQCYYKLVRV